MLPDISCLALLPILVAQISSFCHNLASDINLIENCRTCTASVVSLCWQLVLVSSNQIGWSMSCINKLAGWLSPLKVRSSFLSWTKSTVKPLADFWLLFYCQPWIWRRQSRWTHCWQHFFTPQTKHPSKKLAHLKFWSQSIARSNEWKRSCVRIWQWIGLTNWLTGGKRCYRV